MGATRVYYSQFQFKVVMKAMVLGYNRCNEATLWKGPFITWPTHSWVRSLRQAEWETKGTPWRKPCFAFCLILGLKEQGIPWLWRLGKHTPSSTQGSFSILKLIMWSYGCQNGRCVFLKKQIPFPQYLYVCHILLIYDIGIIKYACGIPPWQPYLNWVCRELILQLLMNTEQVKDSN